MENKEYFVPKVRVQGTLKKSKQGYIITYKEETKTIPYDRIEFQALTLMEAITAIDPSEFKTLTITYNDK